jgi:DNA repair protein RecN (Recombination protein N)
MLTALSIRDIVLIDRLDLAFTDGLTVLTGETGAGKSILLDSLGLALGGRADSRLLRPGCDRGSVTASFDVAPDHPANSLLHEHDLAADETLTLRRVVGADGRTRAYVNDEAVSVNLLRRLGDSLLEIQGQFDERGLLNAATHRGLLDAFGGLDPMRAKTRDAHSVWRVAVDDRARAEADADKAGRDAEFLRHSHEELERLDPVEGEESHLAGTRTVLMNAEALLAALNAGYDQLAGENGAEARLQRALSEIDRAAAKAAGRLDPARSALERTIAETEEAIRALQGTASDIETDAGELERIEERLFALREVARKHAVGVDDLPALRARMERELALIEDGSGVLERLRAAETKTRQAYLASAEALGKVRRNTAGKLDKAVMAELPPLRLDKAVFTTDVTRLPEDRWGPDGMDQVSFLVTTNPGAPPGPMAKIASGGELSRFMLALRVALTATGALGALVFDEVDSGVGGATASAVGERLARLAERMQVLVVTHSPQVAARGHSHMRVEKQATGSLAVTRVDRLEEAARREEVARMLSGREITDEARAAADRLLEGEPA